jgi:hypothetical protein
MPVSAFDAQDLLDVLSVLMDGRFTAIGLGLAGIVELVQIIRDRSDSNSQDAGC